MRFGGQKHAKDLFKPDLSRIDIQLPNMKIITLPVHNWMTGQDILDLIDEHHITGYVICRNSQNFSQTYELLYNDGHLPFFAASNILTEPFENIPLSKIMVLSRTVLTNNQRMTLKVLPNAEYALMMYTKTANIGVRKFATKPKSHHIKVKLPTGLVISVKIKTSSIVKDIEATIHEEFKSLYGSIKDIDGYRFSAIDYALPNRDEPFEANSDLMASLRRQRLTSEKPQFCYKEYFYPSVFDVACTNYMRELDLQASTDTEEVRALNSAMSHTRAKAQATRKQNLMKNPLIARMRISAFDPPLTTYLSNINRADPSTFNIPMKIDLVCKKMKGTTGLSLRVPFDETVNGTIKQLLRKIDMKKNMRMGRRTTDCIAFDIEHKKTQSDADSDCSQNDIETVLRRQSFTDGDDVPVKRNILEEYTQEKAEEAENYVLMLPGTDEVLEGDIPLCNFVCIRHFLLSGRKILNLVLDEKEIIVKSVMQRELLTGRDIREPDEKSLARTISVDTPPELSYKTMPAFPHSMTRENLLIFVKGCIGVSLEGEQASLARHYYLKVTLLNGATVIRNPVQTKTVIGNRSVLFNEILALNIAIMDIPRTARIAFTLYDADFLNAKKNDQEDKEKPIWTFNFPVFRFDGWMNSGDFKRKMWGNRDTDPFLTTCESTEPNPVTVYFSFPEFKFPLAYIPTCVKNANEPVKITEKDATQEEIDRITKLRKYDGLQTLTDDDKALLWRHRWWIHKYPALLPLILLAVDYTNPAQTSEIPSILERWARPSPSDALYLLDAKYPDYEVRKYAVKTLEAFNDNEIMLYLLQLVQGLKHELYDNSPLARFLIRRGLAEPKFVGHKLFWQLIAEAHISHIRQRFAAILMNFMYGIGTYGDELIKGYAFTKRLLEVNKEICENKEYKNNNHLATAVLRQRLAEIEIPKEFHLPMDPRLVVDSFIIDQCKVMKSKKKPFWLVFKNASGFTDAPVMTMFKSGDDLRQDQLTLQVMKVMEYLWRHNGKDFHMRCYGVLPTGNNQGFIEVVPDSVTESELQSNKGTFSGVLATDIITKWLEGFNCGKGLEVAREIFRISSAGYAMATHVLGVADRHPGNIMVQQDGHFFHIDFGHFLGNWKMKGNIPREGELFHFSPACAFTIGANNLEKFEQECLSALYILRDNSKLLITLFMLMVGTGIPELRKPEDIEFLKKKLRLDMTEEEIKADVRRLIKDSMDSTLTKVNNFFHNWKQVNSS